MTSLFSVIPGNISIALRDVNAFSLIWVVAVIVAVIGLFVLLVFMADKVVGLLRLDKGFDEERMDFGNLKATDIVKIGTFIIGGLLIINNIPALLSHTFFAFKDGISGQGYDTTNKFNWAVSGINILLGYLLLTNYGFVARLLKTKNQANE